MDDDELTRLAEEELLREAKRGEARAAVDGVMGWLRDKTPRTNKRFLSNTISNALQHNHRQRSVGTLREEINCCENKEKLKLTKQTDSSHAIEKTHKKIKRSHKHMKSKSQRDHKSGSEDSSSDEETTGYHKPVHRLKHCKLHK